VRVGAIPEGFSAFKQREDALPLPCGPTIRPRIGTSRDSDLVASGASTGQMFR